MNCSKKLNKRQQNRRLAAFQVKYNHESVLDVSRNITPDEVDSLFNAVTSNKESCFGIVKLSSLNFDGKLKAPQQYKWAETISLLQYSTWLRADNISGALLRAGASPFFLYEASDSILSDRVRKFMSKLHPPVVVWILNSISHMQFSASQTLTEDRGECKSISCFHCRKELSLADTSTPVQWPCCGTMCCLRCCYKDVLSSDDKGDTSCPACEALYAHTLLDMMESRYWTTTKDTTSNSTKSQLFLNARKKLCMFKELSNVVVYVPSVRQIVWEGPKRQNHYQNVEKFPLDCLFTWRHLSPQDRKLASLELFHKLPVENRVANSTKQKHVQSLPQYLLSTQRLGSTQKDRTKVLFAAAQIGDWRRILTVVCSGCDVNICNEYGQSVAYICCKWKHFEALRILLWCGVRYTDEDSSGCNMMEAYLSNHFTSLHCHLSNEELSTVEGLSPLSLIDKPLAVDDRWSLLWTIFSDHFEHPQTDKSEKVLFLDYISKRSSAWVFTHEHLNFDTEMRLHVVCSATEFSVDKSTPEYPSNEVSVGVVAVPKLVYASWSMSFPTCLAGPGATLNGSTVFYRDSTKFLCNKDITNEDSSAMFTRLIGTKADDLFYFIDNGLNDLNAIKQSNGGSEEDESLPGPSGPSGGPGVGLSYYRDVLPTHVVPHNHPGRGSFYLDKCFSDGFLSRLTCLWKTLPETPPEKETCSKRYYCCDSFGWVREGIENVVMKYVLQCEGSMDISNEGKNSGRNGNHGLVGRKHYFYPHAFMRFLYYDVDGGDLPPHIDLSKRELQCQSNGQDTTAVSSTHTFILYLSDCESAGETALLLDLKPQKSDEREAPMVEGESSVDVEESGKSQHALSPVVLAGVVPKRGRLLVFPHSCPHSGLPINSCHKLLLRGELTLSHKLQ